MNLIRKIGAGLIVIVSIVSAGAVFAPADALAKACPDNSKPSAFLALPYWYRGLDTTTKNGTCAIEINTDNNFQDIWTIAINIVDILLRIIGVVAVLFIIYGGIRYIISQGDSGGIATAKQTIMRAVIGLAIAIASVFILNFIAVNVFNLSIDKNTYRVQNDNSGGGGGSF